MAIASTVEKACDSPKAIWQACKTACKICQGYSYLPSIQRNDKTKTNNPEEKFEIFKETFFFTPPNADLTDIRYFIYPTGIDNAYYHKQRNPKCNI